MAQLRQKLLWFSVAPIEREFTIKDSDWKQIEGACRRSIPPASRRAISKATQWFLHHEKYERAVAPVAEAVLRVEAYKRGASKLLDSLPAHRDNSDANGYAKSLIRQCWRHGLPLEETREPDEEPRLPDPFEELYDLAASLRSACDAALTELKIDAEDNTEDPFKEGEAWDEWIRRVIQALQKALVRVTARQDRGAGKPQSPFVELVWKLQECLPVGARRHMNSKPALASAIRKVMRNTSSKNNRTRKRRVARR
jgi:hypothetical protein